MTDLFGVLQEKGMCLGSLKKASFDMKTFANELCRFICESLSNKTKPGLVLSTMSPRRFTDFQWYFGKSDFMYVFFSILFLCRLDEDLYRLNKTTPPSVDFYDPLLPVLWMTM